TESHRTSCSVRTDHLRVDQCPMAGRMGADLLVAASQPDRLYTVRGEPLEKGMVQIAAAPSGRHLTCHGPCKSVLPANNMVPSLHSESAMRGRHHLRAPRPQILGGQG